MIKARIVSLSLSLSKKRGVFFFFFGELRGFLYIKPQIYKTEDLYIYIYIYMLLF